MTEAAPLLLGLDIGGTKLGLCIGTADGTLLAHGRMPMRADAAPQDILTVAMAGLRELADAIAPPTRLAALGASCPGPFNYEQGRFMDPPNMPRWHGFALRDWLAANAPAGCPAATMNDANATALAEWRWGAARTCNTAVYLTMSTGMGAGLIVDGRLFEGPTGLAGEIGRIRLREDGPVGFGKRGSVEGFLSGPGMCQLAEQEALICTQTGEPSALADLQRSGKAISADDLCNASAARDAAARRVTDRVATELGRLCAILSDLLNPDVIVLGTIGTAHPTLFIPRATEVMRAEGVAQSAARTQIVPSGLQHRGELSALAVAARLLEGRTLQAQ